MESVKERGFEWKKIITNRPHKGNAITLFVGKNKMEVAVCRGQ
jgi:hypothetical protein